MNDMTLFFQSNQNRPRPLFARLVSLLKSCRKPTSYLILSVLVNFCVGTKIYAETLNSAPDHAVLANQSLTKNLHRWLQDQMRSITPSKKSSTFTVHTILTKNNQWQNATQFPFSSAEPNLLERWYHQFLKYVSNLFNESKSSNDTVENLKIDLVKLQLILPTTEDIFIFSNELKFKFRKQAYVEITRLGYVPKKISVSWIKEKDFNLQAVSAPSSTSLEFFSPLILWIIVFIIVLAIIALVVLKMFYFGKKNGKFSKKKKTSEPKETTLAEQIQRGLIDDPFPNDTTFEQYLEQSSQSQQYSDNQTVATPQTDTSSLENDKEKLRTDLVKNMAKHPYFLRKLYELWQRSFYETLQKDETSSPYLGDKITIIYSLLGEKILQTALPNLHPQNYPKLATQNIDLEANTPQWEQVCQGIKTDFEKLTQHLDNPDPYQSPFGFVKALPDQAVILLLRDKATHIQAITLSQFDHARCQSLTLRLIEAARVEDMVKDIEHYRKYDGYFFQDVASYLAYVLAQTVFKEDTTPTDEINAQHQDSQLETKRALTDISRQRTLGLNLNNPASNFALNATSILDDTNTDTTAFDLQSHIDTLQSTNLEIGEDSLAEMEPLSPLPSDSFEDSENLFSQNPRDEHEDNRTGLSNEAQPPDDSPTLKTN